jgi:hypothetical protein
MCTPSTHFRPRSATLQSPTSHRTMLHIGKNLASETAMNTHNPALARESMSDAIKQGARRALPVLITALRVTIYAVLAVLRPFIVAGLSILTLVGLATSLFYAALVPGSHFPTGLVLIMSAVSAVMIVVFYAVMELLLPQ